MIYHRNNSAYSCSYFSIQILIENKFFETSINFDLSKAFFESPQGDDNSMVVQWDLKEIENA